MLTEMGVDPPGGLATGEAVGGETGLATGEAVGGGTGLATGDAVGNGTGLATSAAVGLGGGGGGAGEDVMRPAYRSLLGEPDCIPERMPVVAMPTKVFPAIGAFG